MNAPDRPFQPLRARSRSTGAPRSTIPVLGQYKRNKIRDIRASRGVPNLVAAAPAREHVNCLYSIGFTNHSIAAAAGVGVNTVRQIAAGKYETSKIDAASRLMAITHRPVPAQTGTRVPAVGAQRRIHALQAIGWTADDIGIRLGVTGGAVTSYARQHRVMYEVWEAIADLYEELSGTPGTSKLSVMRSRERRFAPPLAWEGRDIDDPEAQPDIGADAATTEVDPVLLARILSGQHQGKVEKPERRAVLDHAVENGLSGAEVAQLLNLKKETGDQALVRHRQKLRKEAA